MVTWDMLSSAASELPGSHGKLDFCIFINSQTTFCWKGRDAVAAVMLCQCRKLALAQPQQMQGEAVHSQHQR